MAQGVTARWLVDSRHADRGADRFLDCALIHMMPATRLRARVLAQLARDEYILPRPLRLSVWILAGECVGKEDCALTCGPVALEQRSAIYEMALERNQKLIRKCDYAILGALAIAHEKSAMVEVQILDSQADAFKQPQPRSVLQAGNQPIDAA